ncbi:MAG: hypothetical protein AAGG68_20745 [Bacteroidota bacterium]
MNILRLTILALMLLTTLLAGLAAVHQFTKATGTSKANKSLAFLILTFALSLFNILLLRTSFFGAYEHLYQMPFWFTLSFGPLLFYYVKFTLFPTYIFRGSDLKHLILPLMQFVFVFVVSFQPEQQQHQIWENFIRPIYGPIEYSLFLVFFFLYASLSYRYIRYRLAKLRKKGFDWEREKAWSLRKLVKRLSILAAIYSFFAVTDFVAFNFLNRDLYKVEGYVYLGDLTFVAMLLWLILSAYWKELIYLFKDKSQNIDFQSFESIFKEEKWHRNAELTPLWSALQFKTSIATIKQLIRQHNQQSWQSWLEHHRIKDAQKLLQHPKADRDLVTFLVGFHSRRKFREATEKE